MYAILFSFLALILTGSWPLPAKAEEDPLRIETKVEPYQLSPHQGGTLVLSLNLPDAYHAYADQFKVLILEPDGFNYGEFQLEPIVDFYDKFSKKNRRGIKGHAVLRLPFEAPEKISTPNLKVEVTYQACSQTYCLFPKQKTVEAKFEWSGPLLQSPAPEKKDLGSWSSEAVTQALQNNLFLAFVVVFLSGLLTSFTPCIFPMIPITLAILGHDSQKRSRFQNFSLSLFYVHGIATTYSILGVAAASSGQMFGSALGHPLVVGSICVVFFLMALSMYGVFEIQVPAFLRRYQHQHKTGMNYFGAYLSGIIAGVVASPCVGPVLVTLLAFVASTQNKVLGFFLLFTYALGIGVIFLVLGAFTELTRRLPRSGPWMETMKFLLGSLMLGVFFYYLSFLIPTRWHDALVGLSMIIVAGFFGAFSDVSHAVRLRRVMKGLMQGILVLGIGYLVLAAFDLRPFLTNKFDGPHETSSRLSSWKTFSEAELAQAARENKPVIIDFFAEWCLACHELDDKTFSDSAVQTALKDFVLLRFDSTKDSPELEKMKKKFNIQGLPTVLIFDSTGNWRSDLTLTEFEKPEKFLRRIQKLGEKN